MVARLPNRRTLKTVSPPRGLRFGDPRVMAVLASLVGFRHLVEGFINHQLVARTAYLLDQASTPRQATYDLRRLKRKGLILKDFSQPSLPTNRSRQKGRCAVYQRRTEDSSRLDRA